MKGHSLNKLHLIMYLAFISIHELGRLPSKKQKGTLGAEQRSPLGRQVSIWVLVSVFCLLENSMFQTQFDYVVLTVSGSILPWSNLWLYVGV